MTRDAWAARFDKRYGEGEFAWLCARLEQPRHTFSSIAARYGVTRERVRQWHRMLMPEAPAGRERRRLHRRQQHWRDLLQDDLFGEFYRHARQHAPHASVQPILITHGYSRARALLNQVEVALRRVRPRVRSPRASKVVRIAPSPARVQYVYVLLPEGTFFLLPSGLLPRRSAVFEDMTSSKYQRFMNTFEAIEPRENVEIARADRDSMR